jgi:transcriptional regulator with XRE-family HTH domain
VDWKRLREELARCRLAAHLNQTQLASQIGIAKSTVNRIENVSGEPDHVPDLDTIERWVLATGVRLSVFFGKLESASHPQGSRDAEDCAVSSETDRRALDDLRSFVLRLGEVLTDAAAPADTEKSRPTAGTRPAKSARR